MITLAHLRSCAPAVLTRLRALADLPAHGTVAGQAVASLFYEELGLEMRGPVNDVDVFVSAPSTGQTRALGFSSEEQDYTHIPFISLNSPISICGTAQEGMLNTIAITYPGACDDEVHPHALSQALVDGFDINCVGVGINLHTQEVVASAHFVHFLNTKQMEITTTLTPAHSLVRLSKKSFGNQFSGVACDYTAQRAMIEDFLALRQLPAVSQMTDACTPEFGEKYKQLVEQHPERFPTVEATDGLFHFVPGACSVEAGAAIAALHACKKPLQVFALLHNFPSVWKVLKSQHNDPNACVPLLGALHSARNDGQQFSGVHEAIFGVPLLQSVPLPDNDCAVFFLGCSDRFNPTEVARIVDGYHRLSPLEQTGFAAQEGRADTVLGFEAHKDERVARWFEKSGVFALTHLANVVWDGVQSQRLVELVTHCVGNAWPTPSLEAALGVGGDRHGFRRALHTLFAHFPATHRPELANALFSSFAWVDLPVLPNTVAGNILSILHHAHLPLETALEKGGTQTVVMPLAMEIAQSTEEPSVVQRANVEKLLEHVSISAWLKGSNPLLLEFLKTDHHQEAVRKKTAALGDKWHSARDGLRQRVSDPVMVARFERLVLAQEVGMDRTGGSARRKM